MYFQMSNWSNLFFYRNKSRLHTKPVMQTIRKKQSLYGVPLTHWLVSAHGQFQSRRTDFDHLIKTLAERSSHNKAIWISTTKPILHEATIQLQKRAAFLLFTPCSLFAPPARSCNQQYKPWSHVTHTAVHAFHSWWWLKLNKCSFLGGKSLFTDQQRLPSTARSCLGPLCQVFPRLDKSNNVGLFSKQLNLLFVSSGLLLTH